MTANVLLCGGPAGTYDEARCCWPVRSSKGLADQLVVLGVRPDPEPHDAICRFHAHGAVMNSNARRVEPADFLEMK